jgi:hypothetical protein
LVKSDPVTSWYEFLECNAFSLLPQGLVCTSYRTTIKYLSPFIPSFSYNYLCGSTLLAAYLPVYLYVYSIQLLLPLLSSLLLSRWVSYPSLPLAIRKKLPGVLWPHHWLAKNSAGLSDSSLSQQRPAPRLLLRMDTIMTGHMQDLLILLTFGLCCPLLALVIGASVLSSILNVRLMIGRFILLRHPALKDLSPMSAQTNRSSALMFRPSQPSSSSLILRPTSLRWSSPPSPSRPASLRVSQSDISLVALTTALSDLGRSYHQVLWVIVWSSCFFWTFLSWDIGGDEVGWTHCLWLPLLSPVYIALIRLGISIERNYRDHYRSPNEAEGGDEIVSEIHDRRSLDDDEAGILRPTLELNSLAQHHRDESVEGV